MNLRPSQEFPRAVTADDGAASGMTTGTPVATGDDTRRSVIDSDGPAALDCVRAWKKEQQAADKLTQC